MKELEETNCEISNIINFELPLWDQLNNLVSQNARPTIDGLKESNVQSLGGFLNNDCKYAWISHETRLVVIDIRYGKFITSWNFSNKITSVSPFPTEPGQVPLLLVGLDNNAVRIKDSIGYLCIFDCCTSTILTTIEVPAGVEKACIIHGGAEWEEFNEKRPDTVLSGNTGLIFAALRNLQHIVIDINRSMWKNFTLEGKSITAKLEFVNNPSSKQVSKSKAKKELTHLAYDLMDKEIEQYIGFDRNNFEYTPLYDENLCSVLLSSTKIGCLITGCLGRAIIWQNDGSIGWISPSFDENAYVTHVALLEPSDDPRPFYYLWIACQSDSPESSAVLRMYTMLFNKKRCDKAGESSLYFNLESEPSLKFELELEQGERVHSLLSVERENLRDPSDTSSRRGEDSLLLIGTDERLLMFDLNRWYKEQMPRTMAECRNPNSVMASYRTRSEDFMRKGIIACSYVPRSLREFPTKGPSSPEELFYPNSLTLEWLELTTDNFIFWLARGVQSELLREITIAGPIVIVTPVEVYRRCLTAGLVPFDSSPQDYMYDAEPYQQREMLLSLCLEQRWANFLIRCASEWSDGSAVYLYPEFLRWGVQRASELKLIADRLCIPLFDQSGTNIGETEVKTLRFCCQQLECLTTVVSRLPNLESDLEKQKRALKRIATYLQVILWFYDVGLLPETQEIEDEDDLPHITMSLKIPYPKEKLMEIYKKKYQRNENKEVKQQETLFINQLISHECLPIRTQWEREAGNEYPTYGGYYPPPSLQSLLRSYLTDCHREECNNSSYDDECDSSEMDNKHSITIYLLMDLAMVLQSFYPSVDRLIKYPSAFKLSPSLIKLTQAFWLLDHEDYEGFFKIMTGELIMTSDIKDWHHKIAVNNLLRNSEHKLALMYLRVLKPPLSSMEDQGTIIGLTVERDLVESAFHSRPPSHYAQLLTKFFEACKAHGKLKDILYLSLDKEEEEAFVKFLKEGGCDDTRLLYFLQRCRHTETTDIFAFDTALDSHEHVDLSKEKTAVHPTALKILTAFNATLPEITKRFASSLLRSKENYFGQYNHQQRTIQSFADSNFNIDGYYPRPMSHCRDRVSQIYDIAMRKTRETCFKTERGFGPINHIPFLGAPCSTISSYTKVNNVNGMVEQSEANCVTFAERKMNTAKRTLGMMNDSDNNIDDKTDRKRPRLGSESEINCSTSNLIIDKSVRRLSMSEVCETPLVQRKIRPADNRDPNSVAIETPHSILKIRQMLRRDSNSPNYNYRNSSSDEQETVLQRTVSGDMKPARQIRFSMDRFGMNDDSILSATDSNQDQNEKESNKNIDEEWHEENYYSPDVSVKSIRDTSILSDSSFTNYVRNLRPRPSLRRSSLFSRDSSASPSENINFSNTINASAMETSFEKNKKISNMSPRKSLLSSTLYAASILSSDTSIEATPMKKPMTVNNNEHNGKDVTEVSEEQSEDESIEFVTKSIDKNMFNEFSSSTEAQQQEENEDCNTKKSISISNNLSQENEVINNEENEETELEMGTFDIEKEKDECDQDEDIFQSLSNSLDHSANIPSELITNFENSDINSESKFTCSPKDTSYSRKFSFLNKNQQYSDSSYCDFQHNNHSLSRPIFIDNQGIVKCDSAGDITDDESINGEVSELSPLDLEEQVELTLNLSSSDGCEENRENKEQSLTSQKSNTSNIIENEEENNFEKMISFASVSKNLSPDSNVAKEILKLSEINKDYSLNFESQLSIESDNIYNDGIALKGNTRNQEYISNIIPTPRRSIKSISASLLNKTNEFVTCTENDFTDDRENRGTSVTKEVKKILSKVIQKPIMCTIPFEQTSLIQEKEVSVKEKDKITSKLSEIPVTKKLRTLTEFLESSNNSSLVSQKEKDHSVIEENSNKSTLKRSNRGFQKDKNQVSSIESAQLLSQKSIRMGSIFTKELEKPTRKTRASSFINVTPLIQLNPEVEDTYEEPSEKKSVKSKTTKASSITKDLIVSKTEEKEKVEVLDELHEVNKDKTRRANASKISSLAKNLRGAKKIRSISVEQDEVETTGIGIRRTRASSLIKTSSEGNEKELPVRRTTRASSLAKEISFANQNEIAVTRVTRKRGSSVPKDLGIGLESARLQSRNKRSNSLLKEVILEESLSQLNSSTGVKRVKVPRSTDDDVASSPAGNTRSRRSSIQSVPEDFDDILSNSISARQMEVQVDEGRARRAGSVDSSFVVHTGKRMTRSVLAKSAIIAEAIPEEVKTTRSTSKRQPARRRRAVSVSADILDFGDIEEKTKNVGKSRKGKKNSDKDFLFSLPEEAGQLPSNIEDECRAPTYTFSEPAGLQKFILPVHDDEESSDMTTNLLKHNKTDSECISSTRIQLRSRICFVVSKNTKSKRN